MTTTIDGVNGISTPILNVTGTSPAALVRATPGLAPGPEALIPLTPEHLPAATPSTRGAAVLTPYATRNRNFITQKLVGFTSMLQPGAGTVCQLVQLEALPAFLRFLFPNPGQDSYQIGSCAFAFSSTKSDGVNPTNASGIIDNTLWQFVTFDNQGVSNLKPTQQNLQEGFNANPYSFATTRSLTVPATPVLQAIWVSACSDWIPPTTTLVPTDISTGYWLMIRTYLESGPAWVGGWSGNPSYPNGFTRYFDATFLAGVDAATAPGTETYVANQPSVSPVGIDMIANGAVGHTVIGIGDSIMAGNGTLSEIANFGYRACAAVSRNSRPVGWNMCGVAGAQTYYSTAWAVDDLLIRKPSAAVIQCWSANDGLATQAGAVLGMQNAMAAVAAATEVGAYPILCTAAPVYQAQPSIDEAARQWSNQQVRAYAASSGFGLLDIDALMGTGADPNMYQTQYQVAANNPHPNDLGNQVLANALVPLLQAALGP